MNNIRVYLFCAVAAVCGASTDAWAQDCKPLQIVTSVNMAPSDNIVAVPVTLNDKQKSMIVDTGGAFSEITPDVAVELGTNPVHRGFASYGVAGDATDMIATVPSFTLGSLVAHNMVFVVFPNNFGDNIAGLLAPNLLKQYDLEIDFGTGKVNLLSQDHCEGKVIYWPATAIAVVPIRVTKLGRIMLPVTLDGHEFTAMLDTGASVTSLNMVEAEAAFGLKADSPGVEKGEPINGYQNTMSYYHRFKSITFEGMSIGNPRLELLPDLMKGHLEHAPPTGTRLSTDDEVERLPDMLIGYSTLKHLHIYIAYKEQKLYIAPATPPAAAPSAANPAASGTTATSH